MKSELSRIKIVPPLIKDVRLDDSLKWITTNPKKFSGPKEIIKEEI
jgi:hypothetical protein